MSTHKQIPFIYVGTEDIRIQQAFNRLVRELQLVNDGGVGAGSSTFIRMFLNSAGIVISSDIIPSGSLLVQTVIEIIQAFDGGATIDVTTNGSTPPVLQSTSDNNTSQTSIYEVDNWLQIGATNAGNVVCNVGGTPTVGQAIVVVEYVSNPVG